MNWIDKLERRYGNLGIPNLINGLLIGQLAADIIMLFFNRDFGSLLMLSRTYVLHGQIWRLITFLFQPIWLGGVFGVLNLLFYYWLGNALARVWGDFRTTLFLALGMLGAWVSCFLTGYAGPSAIFQSMLFAYTWLWPDQMVLLFGIIPVQDEIPGLDRAGVLGLQLFDGQLRHQGQPRAGAGGFSGVLWPRGL